MRNVDQGICMQNYAWKRRNEFKEYMNIEIRLLSVKMKGNKKTIFKVEI